MIRTVEAIIDERGAVHLLEVVDLPAARRALVTILEEEPVLLVAETALLSEAVLAADWNHPRKTKHGHTYSRISSARPLSLLRLVTD